MLNCLLNFCKEKDVLAKDASILHIALYLLRLLVLTIASSNKHGQLIDCIFKLRTCPAPASIPAHIDTPKKSQRHKQSVCRKIYT